MLLFASFCTAILSLQYILLTNVYYMNFNVTVLYTLMRWFLDEILNSLDTKKPKIHLLAHFCQYYFKGYQTYPYLWSILWGLKAIKCYTKLVKAVAIDYCRIICAVLPLKMAAGNQFPESIWIVYGKWCATMCLKF